MISDAVVLPENHGSHHECTVNLVCISVEGGAYGQSKHPLPTLTSKYCKKRRALLWVYSTTHTYARSQINSSLYKNQGKSDS